MAKQIYILIAGLLTFVLAASCAAPREDGVQRFDLKKIAAAHSDKTFVGDSEIFERKTLQIAPEDGHNGIVIWQSGDPQNWTEANYLVFEIFGREDFSGVINIEFHKDIGEFKARTIVLQSGETSGTVEDTPWISSLMGILPQVKTQVVFPLSYLDAQNLFVPRSPRQLKGTVSGDRLDPADIVRVVLRFGPYFEPDFLPRYEIASISLTRDVPEPYPPLEEPVVDSLGQWKEKEWQGKLSGERQMIALNRELEKELENVRLPDDWSRYGGWKKKRFEATGYFRTQHDGKRWWLVDPEGYAFLSTGVDGISYESAGPVDGIEDLLEWIPADDDPIFGEAVSTSRDGSRTSMNHHVANMIRVWGPEWKDQWTTLTRGLMRKLRFNTIGNWSNGDFVRTSRVPYVLQLNRFPTTDKLLYRDFPDVFDPQYRENSVAFAAQLADRRHDPCMIGYFLRNEPQWAFGYHNLAYEMFATDQQSATKDEFVGWLANKYDGDVAALNRAWSLELKSFDELKRMTLRSYPSEKADEEFHEFSTLMVMMYVDIPCDEVKKIDSNHLNLGMRYAWLSSDMLYKAGERFDVFSINGYGIDPPPTDEIARRSGKPVLIGEFHHGAVDRALPATGIIGVLNQDDRAAACRNYIEQGFARPELVGMHYFQWVDQPWFGRGDGENYNIGVITSANLPYPELTEAMRLTNERIYRVASGEIAPFKARVTIIPPIHY